MNGKQSSKEKGEIETISYITSSTVRLAGFPDVKEDVYEPSEHRDPKHALGTSGALFHMIKGSLGSGILSMPVAFKNGGLWVSLVGAIFIGVICTHCVHILVYCSQELSRKVKQPSLGYAATAEAAFATGPVRLRKYSVLVREFVDSALMITYYLGCTVYVVFIAASLKQVIETYVDVDLNSRYYVMLTALVIIPVGSVRHIKYLVPFSFIAILCLLFGCMFVLYDVFSDIPPITSRPAFTSIKRLPLFYTTVLFALEGIGTVFPIENAMKKPKHFLGCPGVLNASMSLLIFMYVIMGFFGYLRYGEDTQGSVTLNLGKTVAGETVKLMVCLNVLFSFGLCFCVPCEVVWRKLDSKVRKENKTMVYYIMRVSLIIGSICVGAVLPDLEPFVGLVGALCYSTLGLLFPALVELVTFWEDKEYMGRWVLYKNIFLVFMWLIAMTAGTHASITKIMESLT